MPCSDCACKKTSDHSLLEEASNLTISDKRKHDCSCKAKANVKSCCSSGSCCSQSRPSRGCPCCCRSCCACCRCCSRSTGDYCQERINAAKSTGCKCCNKEEEDVKPVTPTCSCCKRV